jgi:hypothetical protein
MNIEIPEKMTCKSLIIQEWKEIQK